MSKGELKTPSQRQLRVGEELRHALAHILERGEVHDPGLAGVSVTVTEVRVSPDLRNATAFIMPLGGGADADAVDALTRAKGFIRRRLAEMVRLRITPAFSFRLDASFDEAGHIEELLRRPEVARDLAPEDENSPGTEAAAPRHDGSHGHG
ncbi:MAG: 30S ribosome-binding factor RbfA [Rhodospirillales bacterium]|nr:30S ribosome-binding factor RbfA [Rhodospirillales bacterium]